MNDEGYADVDVSHWGWDHWCERFATRELEDIGFGDTAVDDVLNQHGFRFDRGTSYYINEAGAHHCIDQMYNKSVEQNIQAIIYAVETAEAHWNARKPNARGVVLRLAAMGREVIGS